MDTGYTDLRHPSLELQYQHKGEDQGVYGRLTIIFIDKDREENLHHFILAFETIQSREVIDAKQQLTQYYEQLKQSVLENDSYVDALLQTAYAIYSVNLSEDRLEQNFLNKEEIKILLCLANTNNKNKEDVSYVF